MMEKEVSFGQDVLRWLYPTVPLFIMYGETVEDWPQEDLIRALVLLRARCDQDEERHEKDMNHLCGV